MRFIRYVWAQRAMGIWGYGEKYWGKFIEKVWDRGGGLGAIISEMILPWNTSNEWKLKL